MRPLISTGDPKKSVDISRKAELYETSSGMLTITGGKLTTWRRMAKQTVDRLVEREAPARPPATRPRSRWGWRRARPTSRRRRGWGRRPSRSSPSATATRRATVLALAAEEPKLAAPIVPGRPDLLAEATVAARHEQARSVADVLLRRTRLGLLAAPQLRDAAAVRPLAEALGAELGWSRRQVKREAEAWPAAAAEAGVDPAATAAVQPLQ